jgi:hypothetical protein
MFTRIPSGKVAEAVLPLTVPEFTDEPIFVMPWYIVNVTVPSFTMAVLPLLESVTVALRVTLASPYVAVAAEVLIEVLAGDTVNVPAA